MTISQIREQSAREDDLRLLVLNEQKSLTPDEIEEIDSIENRQKARKIGAAEKKKAADEEETRQIVEEDKYGAVAQAAVSNELQKLPPRRESDPPQEPELPEVSSLSLKQQWKNPYASGADKDRKKEQMEQASRQENAFYHQGSAQLVRQRDQVGQTINMKAEEIKKAPYSDRTPGELGNYYKIVRNELNMLKAEYDTLEQEIAKLWKQEEENRDWKLQKEFEAAWEDPNFYQIAQAGEEKGEYTTLNQRLQEISQRREEEVRTPFLENRMTDAERDTYYYYIGQRDTFTANEYLEHLNKRWQREAGAEMAQEIALEEGLKKYADLFYTGAVGGLQKVRNTGVQMGENIIGDGEPVPPGVFEAAAEELNGQLVPLQRGALNLGKGVADAALAASIAKALKLLGPVKGTALGTAGTGLYDYLKSYREEMQKNPNQQEARQKATVDAATGVARDFAKTQVDEEVMKNIWELIGNIKK